MVNKEPNLRFPTNIPELKQSKIEGVAIVSSGHFEEESLHTMRLDDQRRIYILLSNANTIENSQSMHRLALQRILINHDAFLVGPSSHQYEYTGRSHAWIPEINIHGKMTVDDIVPIPLRDILLDTNECLPPKGVVAIDTLNRQAKLELPISISDQVPNKQYYIVGNSLRTTDTFPDTPNGGLRLMVA